MKCWNTSTKEISERINQKQVVHKWNSILPQTPAVSIYVLTADSAVYDVLQLWTRVILTFFILFSLPGIFSFHSPFSEKS